MSEADYVARSPSGIIMDNALMPNEEFTRRLSWNAMNAYLRSFSLISQMRRDDVFTLLPMPIAYEEELVTELKDDLPSPIVISNVNSSEIHVLYRELLSVNTFKRKFLIPSDVGAFRPDQIFFGCDHLQFWTLSTAILTESLNTNGIINRWMRTRVRTWKRYVEFGNPLSLRGAGDLL